MYIERVDNPAYDDRIYKCVLTRKDVMDVLDNVTSHERMELDFFGREGATLEDTLMGLQVCARVLARITTQEQTTYDRHDFCREY